MHGKMINISILFFIENTYQMYTNTQKIKVMVDTQKKQTSSEPKII